MQALSTIHIVTQLFALRTGMDLHLNLMSDYIGVSVRLLSSTIELVSFFWNESCFVCGHFFLVLRL